MIAVVVGAEVEVVLVDIVLVVLVIGRIVVVVEINGTMMMVVMRMFVFGRILDRDELVVDVMNKRHQLERIRELGNVLVQENLCITVVVVWVEIVAVDHRNRYIVVGVDVVVVVVVVVRDGVVVVGYVVEHVQYMDAVVVVHPHNRVEDVLCLLFHLQALVVQL
jgi:hypothetical protein